MSLQVLDLLILFNRIWCDMELALTCIDLWHNVISIYTLRRELLTLLYVLCDPYYEVTCYYEVDIQQRWHFIKTCCKIDTTLFCGNIGQL